MSPSPAVPGECAVILIAFAVRGVWGSGIASSPTGLWSKFAAFFLRGESEQNIDFKASMIAIQTRKMWTTSLIMISVAFKSLPRQGNERGHCMPFSGNTIRWSARDVDFSTIPSFLKQT